jgi:transposase
MDAKIEGILSYCIEITNQYEKPACGRGCCGYETVYESLNLPLACIDNPEKWVAEETQKVKEAEWEKERLNAIVAQEMARKKAEKAEADRIAKEEKERKQLDELKAKYEAV